MKAFSASKVVKADVKARISKKVNDKSFKLCAKHYMNGYLEKLKLIIAHHSDNNSSGYGGWIVIGRLVPCTHCLFGLDLRGLSPY